MARASQGRTRRVLRPKAAAMAPTVLAGAAPLFSAAAFAPDCPYFVNQRLGARVPGDLDLCQAWKVRTPNYPLDPFPTSFATTTPLPSV